MLYIVERIVRPEHLNGANTLFGGILLAWIDEAAAIAAIKKIGSPRIATIAMSEIRFERAVSASEIVRIKTTLIAVGRTSITFGVRVSTQSSCKPVIIVERIVFVALDEEGRPRPHGLPRPESVKKK